VGSVLTTGQTYELRNVQDYFGTPVLKGTYQGTPLRVPMTNLLAKTPIGNPYTLTTTGPTFGVFVLIGRTPPPTVKLSSPARLTPTQR
jgi:hypothetical protein